jgi:hypothetical protein
MPTRRAFIGWSMGAMAGVGTGLGSRLARAVPRDTLAVVVAKNSPLRELSQFELKKLYLGSNLTDPSGTTIVPFNQVPKSPDRVAFDSRVLDMTPEEVAQYWIDRKIRGQSGAPKAVGSAELLQRVVSRLEHSVAYVRLDQLLDEVRVLSIDGTSPGESGYKLFA